MKQQKKINILATGCGGDLGASVARICKSSEIFNRVIGCNNHDDHFSKYLYDDYHVVENFDSSNYKIRVIANKPNLAHSFIAAFLDSCK